MDLAVSDSGPGIPEEQLANLFDRFYRGDADRQKARGSGLGLPIAKAIIDSHEGCIDVWSEPGKGTTVTFRLQGSA
ncbi:MAG: ATP-binding protein [Gemmatimonadetes bacterium]|nr:ATP-binding protein [Gemmatimonadota bacterium]